MTPDIEKVITEAVRVRSEYNPENISPFPHEEIEKKNSDLKFIFTDALNEGISGVIDFDSSNSVFTIFINTTKSKTRQHFTVAHELGHYFLHKDKIKTEEFIIDGEGTLDGARALFRLDDATTNCIEIEANNFAANLIMPEDLVRVAWSKLNQIEECAQIFNVSPSAMAIRLEKLRLLKE